jgi:spermidine/putrescine ABC transporter ATP-binding subunit
MKKLIEFKHIDKTFNGTKVLNDVDFDIYENEFVTLLGPSGCGKTTLLRILGGFLEQDGGEVWFEGEEISKLPPYKRELNTVFQKYALFPHLNVYDNIAFGLKIKKEPKDIIEQKVNRMLKLVGLEEYGKRKVSKLSGGQQQRIAIARALVNEPKVLLLDEPLGALDQKLRKEMQKELKHIQREVGITFICVTHDQEEALTMSDKIVVMKEGCVQQIGTPIEIYNEPKNAYVAQFIGESNIIDGVMKDDYQVLFEDKLFTCVDKDFPKDAPVDVVIRPEDLDIVAPEEGMLKGTVRSVLFKGIHYETIVETRAGASITVSMQVRNQKPVYNEAAGEKMSANDFYLDFADIDEMDHGKIIAWADAQAWDAKTDDWVSIPHVDYEIKKEKGSYPVTFTTAAGTKITVQMIVVDESKVIDERFGEVIYAANFFKNVDELAESVALETDLKTWAKASAWQLSDIDKPIAITSVQYDFDPEHIEEGTYEVTFQTEGYEYKVETTDEHQVGEQVGLTFTPDDIHIMRKTEQ